MTIKVTTASGSVYYFDKGLLTWERNNVKPIWGIPLTSDSITAGFLVEWPVIIVGRGMVFDDTEAGVVYTTMVMRAKVV